MQNIFRKIKKSKILHHVNVMIIYERENCRKLFIFIVLLHFQHKENTISSNSQKHIKAHNSMYKKIKAHSLVTHIFYS